MGERARTLAAVSAAMVAGFALAACAERADPRAPTGDAPALSGRWWAVSDARPDVGIAIDLEDDVDGDGVTRGAWHSFDARASTDAARLAGASESVEVTARRDGERLIVAGPAPHRDARGAPIAGDDTWQLVVEPTADAGTWRGRWVLAREAEFGTGARLELSRAFPDPAR